MADPSTETWRAALDDATKAVNDALNVLGAPPSIGASTSEQLRQTQAALAASQADLTAAKAENADWRATAERFLTRLEEVSRDLWAARYQNRILTAENEAALRRLNEKEGLQ